MSQPADKPHITVWRLPEDTDPLVCIECRRTAIREQVGTNFRGMPAGWYFAIATHDDTGQPMVVMACSKKCALSWERKLPDEEVSN